MTAYSPDSSSRHGCCDNRTITTPVVSYVLENVSDLRAMSTTLVQLNEVAQTLGYYEVGDRGGNQFYWNPLSLEVDNGGTVIAPSGVSVGRWVSLDGEVSFLKFGAKANGVTDSYTYIQKAFDVAGTSTQISTRRVLMEAGYPGFITNFPIVIPEGMTQGTWEGESWLSTIMAGPLFPEDSSLIKGADTLSVFTVKNLQISGSEIPGITPLDLSRTETSIGNRVINIRVGGVPADGIGINMDGCEDSTLDMVSINAGSGKAITWHVFAGNIWIRSLTTFADIYLEYQNAEITSSTTGAIVADGVCHALILDGVYCYASTGSTKANLFTAGSSAFGAISMRGGWFNPRAQNNVVAFQGKYSDNVNCQGTKFDASGASNYSLFSAATVAETGYAPVFEMDPGSTALFTGTVVGTPGARISSNLAWIPFTPQSGWNNIVSVWQTAGYSKNRSGDVQVVGFISPGTTAPDTNLTTLPVGFRPPLSRRFLVDMSTGAGTVAASVYVSSTGEINLLGPATGNIDLSSVKFRAA